MNATNGTGTKDLIAGHHNAFVWTQWGIIASEFDIAEVDFETICNWVKLREQLVSSALLKCSSPGNPADSESANRKIKEEYLLGINKFIRHLLLGTGDGAHDIITAADRLYWEKQLEIVKKCISKIDMENT